MLQTGGFHGTSGKGIYGILWITSRFCVLGDWVSLLRKQRKAKPESVCFVLDLIQDSQHLFAMMPAAQGQPYGCRLGEERKPEATCQNRLWHDRTGYSGSYSGVF